MFGGAAVILSVLAILAAIVSVALPLFRPARCVQTASGPLPVRSVLIGEPSPKSNVPAATAQGRFLAPQAISCVDVSADGKSITIGTMSFADEPNVWQFSLDGTLLANRRFPPWAPMQAATLPGVRGMAVGLAYSRVTSPEPTVWLGPANELLSASRNGEHAEADPADDQFARLQPGDGDWRTGWFGRWTGQDRATPPEY